MIRKLSLLLFMIGFWSSAQPPASLELQTQKLYTAFHDIDIDVLSTMLCSKDDTVYEQLDTYFLNDQSKFRYVFTNAKYHYGAPKTIGDKTFHTINFRNVIRITYYKPLTSVADKQAELKQLFDATSVVYEKARNSFMVVYNAKMIAYAETGSQNWRFIIADHTIPKAISEDCLDADTMKELGLN